MIADFTSPYSGPDGLRIRFRDLNGNIEAGLAEVCGGTDDRAKWLLESLAAHFWNGDTVIDLVDLSVADFDAALAHICCHFYGSSLPCEASCTACGVGFEFNIDLAHIQAVLCDEAAKVEIADGIATDPDSRRRFRLPRLADMTVLRTAGPDAWLRGLLIDGEFAPEMEDEIARAAPVINQDIRTACPDCGSENFVRFDIPAYLLQTLDGEAAFLWREVHLLARRYGWSLADTLALSRSVRRRLAGLIVADRPAIRQAS